MVINTIHKLNLHELLAILFLFFVYNPVSYTRINPVFIMILGILWLASVCILNPKTLGKGVTDKIFVVSLIFPIVLFFLSFRDDIQFEKRCLMEPVFVLIFVFYAKLMNRKGIKTIVNVLVGYIIIISIYTIFMLEINPDISRMMAGSSETYGNFITGGYGTVYLLVLLTTILFSFYLDNKHCKWGVIIARNNKLVIICLLFMLFIIRARYTTAILTLFLGMAAEIIGYRKDRRLVIGIIVAGIVLVLLFKTNLLSPILIKLSMGFPEGIVRNRMHQLADVLLNLKNGIISSKASIGTLQRVDLYMLSIGAIQKNWLWGVGNIDKSLIGGHATFLDVIAQYGVVCGGLFIVTRLYILYAIANKYLVKSKANYRTVVFLYVFLSFLNTTEESMILATMIILIPFLCYLYEN